ncbi:aminotransferase class V-fold PLP-dependent enzyme [Mycobacterium sp. CBMA247]|nr:aminotransferase class V-fold PLP-dependent enzyme [Mycolicibacterium sp. CBMA 329]MUL90698.1 aminotransferase class V-fold PLP-dependent enzyme [Mycolicibacterium sp. CBMA 331]MUM00667.1 aminotransferase class V-fold PLP-dependent enzyme [Mycolicibacterium sp. CBMA 334]MUM28638.1 aminotransferase class V-fold PLP-dependent enzyme [Mycolicibacterium sp. CBMA 295]MUM41642.1 aminotransferase class V-fold PLP-dependent enzyme [Mycolicibacterium sp. CBMA 247]MUM46106.1 aminotransferase class V-
MPSHAFASDNAAPAHPKVIDAITAANHDAVASYGNDPATQRATEAIKAAFDSPDAEVLFALTGTAANIIALASAVRPWQEILCSDIAHSLVDEAGGPVRLSGAPLTKLPSDNGLIDAAALDTAVARRGPVHHSQPRIVTITQSTENGRVWTPQAIKDFIDHAHDLDLLVHIDGSRIANAIAALDISPPDAIADADIVTVGGTKNGMLMGDAILVRRPELFDGIHFVQKQIGQLASKQRFVAAQFEAVLNDGLWLQTAAHANQLAARLSTGFQALGLRLACPTEANEVFVDLEPTAYAAVSAGYAVHRPDTLLPTVRFVCSWATTEAEIDDLLRLLRGT